MTSFSEFLSMGGYASFVWPAYAIVALVMVALAIWIIAAFRKSERALTRLERAQAESQGGEEGAPNN